MEFKLEATVEIDSQMGLVQVINSVRKIEPVKIRCARRHASNDLQLVQIGSRQLPRARPQNHPHVDSSVLPSNAVSVHLICTVTCEGTDGQSKRLRNDSYLAATKRSRNARSAAEIWTGRGYCGRAGSSNARRRGVSARLQAANGDEGGLATRQGWQEYRR